MPALSSTMTEGKIVLWVNSEGDVLSKGDSLVVVESDKADMDVETFYDGIPAAIVVTEGPVRPRRPPRRNRGRSCRGQGPPTASEPSPAPVKEVSNAPRKAVGSGPNGRITPADVEKAAGVTQPERNVTPVAVTSSPPKDASASPADPAAPAAASAPILGLVLWPLRQCNLRLRRTWRRVSLCQRSVLGTQWPLMHLTLCMRRYAF